MDYQKEDLDVSKKRNHKQLVNGKVKPSRILVLRMSISRDGLRIISFYNSELRIGDSESSPGEKRRG